MAGFTSFPLSNVAGVATTLAITTPPSGAVAGANFTIQPIIHIQDANGRLRIRDNATVVTAALLGGSGVLLGAVTATAVGGVVTFATLRYDVAEAIIIQFSVAGLDKATVRIAVVAGVPAQLVFAQTPTIRPQRGKVFPMQPTLQLYDAFGNQVGLSGVVVTAAITAGDGTLPTRHTATTDTSGQAVFSSLRVTGTLGTQQLTFSAPSVSSAVISVILVAWTSTQLSIVIQPDPAPAVAAPFPQQPVLQLFDGSGDLVTTDNTTFVLVAPVGGTGALGGTLSVQAVSGVVTFTDLQYAVTEVITLVFTAAGLSSVTSAGVTVQ